jgi:hypothetical protein
VIVEVDIPFATTVVGVASTCVVAPEGGPATKVMEAVVTILTLPLTKALMVVFPAVVDRTVPVICPLLFVVPEG